MKRIIASTAAAAVVLLLAWLAGFDYDKRGMGAFFTAVVAIYVWGVVYFVPTWREEQR